MDGSYNSIAAVGDAKWFVDKIKAHNAAVDAMRNDCYYLTPGTALVIAKEINDINKVIRLNITTPHMLLHFICDIDSGWDITISEDGIFCLCKNEFGTVIFLHRRVVGLHGETFQLCYSIVPEKSIFHLCQHVETGKGMLWRRFI